MRIALCQIDPTVGDLEGNAAKIREFAEDAHRRGARLAIFPELALLGYPPRDLLDRPDFLERAGATLEALAEALPPSLTALVGCAVSGQAAGQRCLYNSLAVLEGGDIRQVAHKLLLPTYDVFDDRRHFTPGAAPSIVEVDGVRLGITICEDIWAEPGPMQVSRYKQNPVVALVGQGVDCIINVAASPFTNDKRLGRDELLRGVALRRNVPVVFVNQVGGNDDIVFDGSSCVYGVDGTLLARARAFAEDNCVVSLDEPGPIAQGPESEEAAVLEALVLGTRDYVHKSGFSKAVLGLSGGIDSALTAAIAARALGAENVLGVAMPTRYSSAHSVEDAEALAANLGIEYRQVGIDPLFQAYLDALPAHLDAVAPSYEGDVTLENVQARIRGNVLMAISNRSGRLLLTTGNKSEIAVGYCTLYGDMAGALAVISDLPKTWVYALSRELNRQAGRDLIPERTLTKPPSAELRPDQTDQDSLPDYDTLDAILDRFVEGHEDADRIIAAGFDPDVVRRVVHLVRINEYKRRQMPPGLIVSSKAFGSGRRYPLAQRFAYGA